MPLNPINSRDDSRSTKERLVVHGWRISLLLLIASLIILGLIIATGADFEPDRILMLVSQLGISLITMLLMLSLVNFALRSLRWHWYTRCLDIDMTLRHSITYYLAGFSMGVTPGRMGELIRLWMMKSRHGISYHRALPLLIGDRVNDLLVIVILALGASMMLEAPALISVFTALSLVIAANILLRYPKPLLLAIGGLSGLFRRWRKPFAAMRRSLKSGSRLFSAYSAVPASLFSIIAWFAECLAFYLLLSTLDTGMTLEGATFIYTFATLVGALTFLPGGLGGFEATAIVLLGVHNVDFGTAAFSVSVIRLTTLWFSVILGSVLLSFVLIDRGHNNQ